MKTTHLLPLLAVCGLALRLSAPAQTLSVDSLVPAGNQLTITVRNTGTANAFQLQTSPTMAAGTWAPLTAAFTTVPGETGFFRASFTKPVGDRVFFRVLGTTSNTGTAGDVDGDGLGDVFETGLGTNPNLFDTDGDGFSDGVEFSLGTNPTLPSSFPERANMPAVEFTSANTLFTEGDAPFVRIQLTFSQPFQGSVPYTVSSESTMLAPADFAPLSGAVSFNGTTANLDIDITDDFLIKPSRFLLLKLTPPPLAAGYRVAGGSTHFCSVSDNDGYWSGGIQDTLMVRSFRLRILRKAGQPSQIAFVSGASDGLPVVDNGDSSQSTGIIPSDPQTVWEAEGIVDTAALFTANSPLLPVTVSSPSGFNGVTSSITSEPITRRLLLTASQALNPAEQVQRNLIVGRFTEEIRAVDTTKTFLDLTRSGVLVLMREIPRAPRYTPPTVPN